MNTPLIVFNKGEVTLEWWQGDRKLTLFIEEGKPMEFYRHDTAPYASFSELEGVKGAEHLIELLSWLNE